MLSPARQDAVVVFYDFGTVFRFHWMYGVLSWTINSLQRFVKLLCIVGVGEPLYLLGLLNPPFVLHLYLVAQFLPSLTPTGRVLIAEHCIVSFVFLVQQTKDVMALIIEPVLTLRSLKRSQGILRLAS